MSKFPITDAKTLEKILLHLGFFVSRQKGSHRFYKHRDGKATTIPHHPGRDISRPLIKKICNDVKLDPEEYKKLLKDT